MSCHYFNQNITSDISRRLQHYKQQKVHLSGQNPLWDGKGFIISQTVQELRSKHQIISWNVTENITLNYENTFLAHFLYF